VQGQLYIYHLKWKVCSQTSQKHLKSLISGFHSCEDASQGLLGCDTT